MKINVICTVPVHAALRTLEYISPGVVELCHPVGVAYCLIDRVPVSLVLCTGETPATIHPEYSVKLVQYLLQSIHYRLCMGVIMRALRMDT